MRFEILLDLKIQCLDEAVNNEQAICLALRSLEEEPDFEGHYLTLAEAYLKADKKDSAREILRKGIKRIPNSETILAKYGLALLDENDAAMALLIYEKLSSLFPQNTEDLTLLGNALLSNDLYGLSLESYQRANELVKEREGWILGNTGNAYNNKGFYPQAIEYLKQALALDADSQYAHERLASAIKNNQEEKSKRG